MAAIQPNTEYPTVGGLIILYYNGVKHIAVIVKVTAESIFVKEANFEACNMGKREIARTDPHIDGFWRKNV